MKTWIKILLLSLTSLGIIVLWVLGINSEHKRPLKEPMIIVHVDGADAFLNEKEPVTYTHLTLPTILRV